MADSYGSARKKPLGTMIIAGIASLVLYGILLSNQDVANDYMSRGGLFALIPIAIAFLFSIVHGSFTGKFWTVLGIEAAKKKKEVK